jgi:polyhydroxybutyrate depolymerase
LYLPENAGKDTPLVIVLHGYGGSAEKYCPQMMEVAEKEGFAVCYPQGLKDGKGKNCWNVGYPFQADLRRDDVGYLVWLVKKLRKQYDLSPKNAFLTGMSNCGEMSYLMAHRHPEVFNAFAPIAGLTMEWTYKQLTPKAPVPLMEVHGTADKTSMWEGDPTDTGGWGAYIAVPLAVGYWAAQARCTNEETVTLPQKGEHPVVLHRYLGGDDGIEVRLYEVQGAKHSWHLKDMDTCEEMWGFFRQYLK